MNPRQTSCEFALLLLLCEALRLSSTAQASPVHRLSIGSIQSERSSHLTGAPVLAMSRRTTLGALSAGMLNSRASMGPERVASQGALGGVAGPRANRKSMLPSSMPAGPVSTASLGSGLMDVRRSSAYNSNKPAGPKADPRPLGDKTFQGNCIRTIITYLSTHSYTASVSPKTLASPTGKDFAMIVQVCRKHEWTLGSAGLGWNALLCGCTS